MEIKPKKTIYLPINTPKRMREGYTLAFDYDGKEYCVFPSLMKHEVDSIKSIDPEYNPIVDKEGVLSSSPILRIRINFSKYLASTASSHFESFAIESTDYYLYAGLLV